MLKIKTPRRFIARISSRLKIGLISSLMLLSSCSNPAQNGSINTCNYSKIGLVQVGGTTKLPFGEDQNCLVFSFPRVEGDQDNLDNFGIFWFKVDDEKIGPIKELGSIKIGEKITFSSDEYPGYVFEILIRNRVENNIAVELTASCNLE